MHSFRWPGFVLSVLVLCALKQARGDTIYTNMLDPEPFYAGGVLIAGDTVGEVQEAYGSAFAVNQNTLARQLNVVMNPTLFGGGPVDVGIYTSGDLDNEPLTLLDGLYAVDLSQSEPTIDSITLSSPLSLVRGMTYWVGIVSADSVPAEPGRFDKAIANDDPSLAAFDVQNAEVPEPSVVTLIASMVGLMMCGRPPRDSRRPIRRSA
jgi:hypothetical protein